jgi:signal transduction histidine kinase
MWTRLSLERKLLGVVLIVLLLTGSGLVGVVVVAMEKERERRAAHTARALSKAIENSLRSAMLSGDADVVRVAVETVVGQSDVSSVAVLDDTGGPLVQAGVEFDGRGTMQALTRDARSSGLVSESPIGPAEYAVVSPILTEPACTRCHGDEARLGFISAVVSTVGEENRIRGMRSRLLGGGIALLAVTCAVLYMAIQKWVARPVVRLTHAVDAMQGDAVDTEPLPDTGDEITRLAQSFESMKASIAQKTDALIQAERRSADSQRLGAIGLLAAGIAHEIGSPLSTIQLQAGFWEERSEGPTRAAALGVGEAARRIAQLRRELLTFDRREALQYVECDLRLLVRECLALIDRPGPRCELSVPEEPVPVFVDPRMLARALTNVLDNATQAMQGQGKIAVTVRRAGRDRAEVTVRDTGPGLPPEDVDRVFEPFVTSGKRGQGSGLGLTIAREILTRHHGEITAEATADGACFRISLPLKQLEGDGGHHSHR